MRPTFFVSLLATCLFTATLFAQSREDVVYFKNGSQIHGQVLEQWPGVSIKVRFNDGTVQVYRMSDVSKIAQFDLPPQNLNTGVAGSSLPSLPTSNPGLGLSALPSRAGKVGFGLLAGMDLANQSFSGAGGDILVGFTGGCFVDFGLTDMISIEPELYFSMKGYNSAPYSEHMNYLELAPLFKLNFPGGPDVRFDLFTGPSFAVLLASYFSYSGTDYAEFGNNNGDAGWIVGGGLEIGQFLVDLRDETDFVPVYGGSSGGPTNNTFSLMVGCRLFN